MKKTYATSMPNHIGAFLKASKCFASLGINITRVSYDKAVDSHMLFLDVEGTEEHHIVWVYLQTDRGGQRKCLEVGKAPTVTFALADEKPIAAYAYCNLHGLWKKEI